MLSAYRHLKFNFLINKLLHFNQTYKTVQLANSLRIDQLFRLAAPHLTRPNVAQLMFVPSINLPE